MYIYNQFSHANNFYNIISTSKVKFSSAAKHNYTKSITVLSWRDIQNNALLYTCIYKYNNNNTVLGYAIIIQKVLTCYGIFYSSYRHIVDNTALG
ncbi:hypothetical protein GBAR_LOCUS30442 [Geodia barretti]|uniref:Uncharacterized protein n=1 Tax=Geodia barretti TaxID=519541 RepID=A0AA35TXQ8_GEOBA|nr:hypothetical protein GBAR_LOCUS30442 [Geodia barretti]